MSGLLAEAVMILHFGFLVFVTVGGFLAWRWPRLLVAHVVAVAWGAAIVGFGWLCPLTSVENLLRVSDGQPQLVDGFIDTYLTGVIYPGDRIAEARFAVAAAVAVSWAGLVVRRRERRRAGAASAEVD